MAPLTHLQRTRIVHLSTKLFGDPDRIRPYLPRRIASGRAAIDLLTDRDAATVLTALVLTDGARDPSTGQPAEYVAGTIEHFVTELTRLLQRRLPAMSNPNIPDTDDPIEYAATLLQFNERQSCPACDGKGTVVPPPPREVDIARAVFGTAGRGRTFADLVHWQEKLSAAQIVRLSQQTGRNVASLFVALDELAGLIGREARPDNGR